MSLILNNNNDEVVSATSALFRRGSVVVNPGIGTFTGTRASDTTALTQPNAPDIDTEINVRVDGTLNIRSLSTAALNFLFAGKATVNITTGSPVAAGTKQELGTVETGVLYRLDIQAADGEHHVSAVAGDSAVSNSNYSIVKQGSAYFIHFRQSVAGSVSITYSGYTPIRSLSILDTGDGGLVGEPFDIILYSETRRGDIYRRVERTIYNAEVQTYGFTEGSKTEPLILDITYSATKNAQNQLLKVELGNFSESIFTEITNAYANALSA